MIGEDMQRELQSIMVQIEDQKAQHGQLARQAQILEEGLAEINATREAIKSVKEQKPGTNILVPLGSGSFLKGTLADNKTLLLGIGAGVTIEKSLPEADKFLEEKNKEMVKTLEKIRTDLENVGKTITALNQHAEIRVQELRAKEQK
ncbi:prefoldin subunit alpha [Candidatus Altiarchaeota archaeon]